MVALELLPLNVPAELNVIVPTLLTVVVPLVTVRLPLMFRILEET
jgi:hypothetical protein